MTRPVNVETIAEGTARSWEEWLEFMRSIGAQVLTHKEIAERVEATGDANGWWAQTITVAFEQHIGRREPGQSSSGRFAVSVSKTLDMGPDEALARWQALMAGRTALDQMPFVGEPQTSVTDAWRYWRATLADGSRIGVNITAKSGGRSIVGIGHENLDSRDSADYWRPYWKGMLERMVA